MIGTNTRTAKGCSPHPPAHLKLRNDPLLQVKRVILQRSLQVRIARHKCVQALQLPMQRSFLRCQLPQLSFVRLRCRQQARPFVEEYRVFGAHTRKVFKATCIVMLQGDQLCLPRDPAPLQVLALGLLAAYLAGEVSDGGLQGSWETGRVIVCSETVGCNVPV